MRSLADWLEQQQQSHPSAIDLTLERVREVARRLDLLTPAYRVITVGGTNGKGSTVAYLDALLRAVGQTTGRFTSPHLRRYNERICVDGIEAADADLIESFERIEAARREITLTFFEYNTLAALDRFRRAGIDTAVLEVGLGGRLDATNIIDADVSVVCSIGLDHVDWLGGTLEQIGREKAGIFRAARPAVLGSPDLPDSVHDTIRDIGAIPVVRGPDIHPPRPPPAPQQIDNAAPALAALAAGDFGVELSHARVSQALRAARLPGRFQVVPGEVEWVLDVAHNVPAAAVLAQNLGALPARRTLAVFGILGDKDIRGILATLAGCIDAWIPVTLDGPRSVSAQMLATCLPADASIVERGADVAAGCRAALKAAAAGDRIVVFGSFLTVGPALEFLGI